MIKVASTIPERRFEIFGIKFPADWSVKWLDYPLADEGLINACADADFLLVQSVHTVSRNVVENSPSLRLIHVEGVAFDKVDAAAAAQVGLPVCNNRAANNTSVAEHTVGLMIACLRHVAACDREIKAGNYTQFQTECRTQGIYELSSRHIGLVGMGAIGQMTAKLLLAFGCKISYFDEFRPSTEREKELNINYLSLKELLSDCDVISLHVPVLPNTLNLIGAKELSIMKNNACLINTSRGEVLDQKALAENLEKGRLYAAVDTLSPEPPPEDHPLLKLTPAAADRITLTSHVAGTTNEAFTRMLQWTVSNLQRVVNGEDPVNIVNGLKHARTDQR